jgi:hypothetical protein
VLGKDNLKKIVDYVRQGHNVVLLANHQVRETDRTEPNPPHHIHIRHNGRSVSSVPNTPLPHVKNQQTEPDPYILRAAFKRLIPEDDPILDKVRSILRERREGNVPICLMDGWMDG